MVAGHACDQPSDHVKQVWQTLFTQLNKFIAPDIQRRLITGYRPGIEQLSLQSAEQAEWDVHLLLTHKLYQTQGLDVERHPGVSRIISLGREQDEPGLIPDPVKMRDRIGLDFADILIANWNGECHKLEQRTTLNLIAQAARSRKPVIWIDPQCKLHWLDLNRLDDPMLLLLKASDYATDTLMDCFVEIDGLEQTQLAYYIEHLLNPTLEAQDENSRLLLELAQAEAQDYQDTGRLHDLMSTLLHGDQKGVIQEIKNRFKRYRRPKLWNKTTEDIRPKADLNRFFAHHDRLADKAGGLHRSNIWLLYGFAALAVLVAVSAEVWQMHWLAYVELILITSIMYRVWWAKKVKLHQKWIRHRYLAEQMRYCIMGYPLMAIPQPFREPVWQVNPKGQLQLNSPEFWLLQRHLIIAGLPCQNGRVYTPPYHNHVLAKHVQASVKSQMRYHQAHHHQKQLGHHRLHFLAELQFGLTFIAVVLHIYIHDNWLLLFTAALPAFAAAMHGILTKLEMERVSGQSASLYLQLEQQNQALERFIAMTPPGDDSWHHWISLRYLADTSQQVMSDNITQWQHLIQKQQTEIPA